MYFYTCLILDAVRRSLQIGGYVGPGFAGASPIREYLMNTGLLVAILSIVALHVAALVGGGLALGVMRLLGHGPASAANGNGSDE